MRPSEYRLPEESGGRSARATRATPGPSRALVLSLTFVASFSLASTSHAQQAASGFAVERLYTAAPGASWVVMDGLDMHGGLGGAVSIASGYASNPLRISDGAQSLRAVSDQAFFNVGLAATYDRLKLYLNFDAPLGIHGASGTIGGYRYTGPSVSLASHPDTESDFRIGLDARLFGAARGPFRLGVGVQVIATSGNTADYSTDGTYREMVRALVAGDIGPFTYAAQVGLHFRPDLLPATPGAPRGPELLFGAAAGPKISLGKSPVALIFGPEVFGETALKALFGGETTGVEGLFTARVEGTGESGSQLQFKVGAGGGIHPEFGAPEWRCTGSITLFDHSEDTDHDGVPDSKDACPTQAGAKTGDPKTNGCPVKPDAAGFVP